MRRCFMNTNWVYIKDLKNHVDELVEFRGWVWNKRSSGKIAFLQLRDGTGFIQGVAEKKDFDDETFEKIRKIKKYRNMKEGKRYSSILYCHLEDVSSISNLQSVFSTLFIHFSPPSFSLFLTSVSFPLFNCLFTGKKCFFVRFWVKKRMFQDVI